jgi:hypothetical protein
MQPTTIEVRAAGAVVILEVRGPMTRRGGVEELEDAIWKMLEGGYRELLVNVSGISSIDRKGAIELILCFSIVNSFGGHLTLAGVGLGVEKRLRKLGVFEAFPICEAGETADTAVPNAPCRRRRS